MKTTKTISEVIEKEVRLQVLKEQKARLEKELRLTEAEITKLESRKPLRKVARGPVPRIRGQRSLRLIALGILKRAKKPLHIDEILKRVKRTGYRSRAKSLRVVLYNMLIVNRRFFRRVAEGTFEAVKPQNK